MAIAGGVLAASELSGGSMRQTELSRAARVDMQPQAVLEWPPLLKSLLVASPGAPRARTPEALVALPAEEIEGGRSG